MLIISKDSLSLKVKSAFGCNPKTSGLSTDGTLSIYSLYFPISLLGFAGILYLYLSFVAVPDPSEIISMKVCSFPKMPSLI